jgi:ribosomal protein S19
VEVKPEMIDCYLAEFSITYKPTKHVPETIGNLMDVYNGSQYINVEVKPKMIVM